jgi:hypothetical protein
VRCLSVDQPGSLATDGRLLGWAERSTLPRHCSLSIGAVLPLGDRLLVWAEGRSDLLGRGVRLRSEAEVGERTLAVEVVH